MVDARGAVALTGTDALKNDSTERHRTEVVRRGIPHVRGDGITAMSRDDRSEATFDFTPRLVPFHFDVHAVALDQRLAQSIGVVVQLLQRAALRADVTARKDIVDVAANARDRAVLHGDLETTAGLTQRTGSVGGSVRDRCVGHRHSIPRFIA